MEVLDQIYCFEIARRSVGRAAFHLGIDSMTEAALDALADILLSYLNRVGKALSHLVESSGRTSAHVNILDTLTACQMVAPPVVQHLHLKDPSAEEPMFGAGVATHSNNVYLNTPDWKGLAAFLFGPKWLEDSESSPEGEAGAEEPILRGGAGGKRGPSATGANPSDEDPSQRKTQQGRGWDAPYLDEVPPFPQASDSCANPHPMPPHVGLSLHRTEEESEQPQETAEMELQKVPDQVFYFNSWGDLDKITTATTTATTTTTGKRKEPDSTTETTSPPKKKVRIDDGKQAAAKENDETHATNQKQHPPHVPSFYPPAPYTKLSSQEGGRLVVEPIKPPQPSAAAAAAVANNKNKSSTPTTTLASQNSVRSSLVQLGKYWGSGWDTAHTTTTTKTTKLAVPLGRGTENDGEQQNTTKPTTVVPLGRASGSRVSRILEGSMDAAAMQ